MRNFCLVLCGPGRYQNEKFAVGKKKFAGGLVFVFKTGDMLKKTSQEKSTPVCLKVHEAKRLVDRGFRGPGNAYLVRDTLCVMS